MAKDPLTYTGSPSTTWKTGRIRVSPAPKAQGTQSAKRAIHALRPREPREKLTITVRYRGGPECWWEIHARGETVRVPGHAALHDTLMTLNGQSI